jgi:hypothetical protein
MAGNSVRDPSLQERGSPLKYVGYCDLSKHWYHDTQINIYVDFSRSFCMYLAPNLHVSRIPASSNPTESTFRSSNPIGESNATDNRPNAITIRTFVSIVWPTCNFQAFMRSNTSTPQLNMWRDLIDIHPSPSPTTEGPKKTTKYISKWRQASTQRLDCQRTTSQALSAI